MYSDAFCNIYNQFGWNYFPEAFAQQLLTWIEQKQIRVRTSLDLACGTGILCEALYRSGIKASGMDFTEGMIRIAKESNPDIFYEVADMILYRPEQKYDLVTCTGDALNHIIDLKDVEKIFQNVFYYLNRDGYFVFDILNEDEVAFGEPFDLDYTDTVRARFHVTQDQKGIINLQTRMYENDVLQFEENITETVHDPEKICELLRNTGFEVISCAHQLLENSANQGNTWFVIAHKPKSDQE